MFLEFHKREKETNGKTATSICLLLMENETANFRLLAANGNDRSLFSLVSKG
jgi:hypothetical protein